MSLQPRDINPGDLLRFIDCHGSCGSGLLNVVVKVLCVEESQSPGVEPVVYVDWITSADARAFATKPTGWFLSRFERAPADYQPPYRPAPIILEIT